MDRPFYSITFGEKNTWDEWAMMPVKAGKIEFSAPPVREEYAEVPGMNGSLDMSEVLTGYPIYENRTGTVKFRFFDNGIAARSRYTQLKNYLHGKKMRAVIADDSGYYYEGRFSVRDLEFAATGNWADVEISYNVKPYKNEVNSTVDEWEWDPFSFESGVIRNYKNISVTGDRTVTVIGSPKPTTPTFTVTNDALSMLFDGITYSLPVGTTILPQIVLMDQEYTFQFTGSGDVSIEFRGGSL